MRMATGLLRMLSKQQILLDMTLVEWINQKMKMILLDCVMQSLWYHL